MTVLHTIKAARNLQFEPILDLKYAGAPLPITGATITMEVRQYPGQAGDPLVEDTNVGIYYDLPSMVEGEGDKRILRMQPIIAKADLQAIPEPANYEAGELLTLYYEIKITYADTLQDSLMIGEFILSAGVNMA